MLDFEGNALLEALTNEYRGRIQYISANAKDRLGLSAVLIRPDGIVAWACNRSSDSNEHLSHILDRYWNVAAH
ncbi:hypothetical protein D3C86_2079540 [compost metagenome]